MLVKDGERLGPLVQDPADGSAHGHNKGSKGVELVVQTLTCSKLDAFEILARQDDPGKHGEGIPGCIDRPTSGIKEALLDALHEQRAERIGLVDRQRERAAKLLGACKVEVVREEGYGERDKSSAQRTSKFVVLGLWTELLFGQRLLAHGGRLATTKRRRAGGGRSQGGRGGCPLGWRVSGRGGARCRRRRSGCGRVVDRVARERDTALGPARSARLSSACQIISKREAQTRRKGRMWSDVALDACTAYYQANADAALVVSNPPTLW